MGVLMRKRGRVPSDFDGVIYSQVGGALIQRAVSGFAERKSDHWIRLLVGSRCIEQRRWEPELLSAYQRGFVFRIARLCE
jgi:hypothetical protein